MSKSLLAACCASLLTLTLAQEVSAKPRSNAAAVARLPDTTEVLVSANVKAMKGTELFQKVLLDRMMTQKKTKEALATVKRLCKLDPLTSIEDATLAVLNNEEGGGFLALDGVDEKTAVACAVALVREESGGAVRAEKITSKTDATIYRLTADSAKKEFFIGFLPDNVLVIGSKAEDKAQLEALLSGKGSLAKRSKLASRLAKLDVNAALSGVVAKETRIEGKKVRGGDLTLRIENKQVKAAGSVEFAEADDAKELAKLISSVRSLISGFGNAKVQATTRGSILEVSAEASESELVKALADLLKGK